MQAILPARFWSANTLMSKTELSASLSHYKIENAKQAGIVGPQFNEIKPGLASQRDETFWRVLVRMLGQDFFTGVETKLSSAYMRSEEHTSELQSRFDLVCRLL